MPNQASAAAEAVAGENLYDALHAVLSSTARGRAFLAEHARRSRHADVEALMSALQRLEGGAQPQIDLAELAKNVAHLAELIESLRGDLQAKTPSPVAAEPTVAPPPSLALSAVAAQALAGAAQEPELRVFKAGSIPAPVRFAGFDFSSDAPKRATEEAASAPSPSSPPTRPADPDLPDPLAPILALSEEERLALFG